MVSQTYYPFLAMGGRPTKVRALATRLAQRGHGITVLTVDFGLDRQGVAEVPTTSFSGGRRATQDGVETIYLRSQAKHRTLTFNWGVVDFCRRSMQCVDVVHIFGVYDFLGPVVARHCRRRDIPYFVEPIGMFRPIARSFLLKRVYHSLLGTQMIRGAAAVIATSNQEKQELIEGGVAPEKIIMRRNGVELPERFPERGSFRRQQEISPEARIVLFLGRLISKKNPDVALEAFARWRRVSPRGESARLVLAGPDEGGTLQKLKQRAQSLGIQESALFVGPLFGENKWEAYRDADVFVLPSLNENFGNSAAEAAACGTPVVVTDQCGIAPYVRSGAGLVIRCGVEPLAMALGQLLDDPHLRERCREGCEAMTRGLSWEEPVAQMEEIYRSRSTGAVRT